MRQAIRSACSAKERPASFAEAPASPGRRRRRPPRGTAKSSHSLTSKGITSFHDAGSSFATIDLIKALIDEGRMNVRLWVMVREGNEREAPLLAKYRTIDYGAAHLTVRAIKRAIDGAL